MEGLNISAGEIGSTVSTEPSSKRTARRTKSRYSIEQNVLDSLVYRGILSQGDLDRAMEESKDGAHDLEALLLDRYHVPKDVIGAALSDYYQCPYLPYDERTAIDVDLLKTLNHDYLKKKSLVADRAA